MSIVVTGATGHLGHLVVEQLLARGVAPEEVLATGRSLAPLPVRTAVLDYADVDASLLGAGDTVLLVSASVPGDRVALHTNVIEAAAKAGVARIVYTSAPKADDTPLVLAPEHAGTEAVLRAGGVPFTILRNNWYIENYASVVDQARTAGEIVGSAGTGRIASATRAEFAEATAVVLTTDGHANATYELGGDTAWTFGDLAAALGPLVGRDVTYRSVSPAEHLEILRAAGLDEGTAGFVVALDGNIAEGTLDVVTKDLAHLLGRPTSALTEQLRTLL